MKDADGAAITSETHVARLNPYRYRGYYYDEETGFYYCGSRYYDPIVCRWLNADGRVCFSLGITGANLFAYCLNNPISKSDYTGYKPGDLFDKEEDAAIDFAKEYNSVSISEDREYAANIYKVKTYEYFWTIRLQSIVFENANGDRRFVIKALPYLDRREVTKYSYGVAIKGKREHVDPSRFLKDDNNVAIAHTHGAYNESTECDILSFADTLFAKGKNKYKREIVIYLATPSGTLYRFNPFIPQSPESTITCDIPFDENDPYAPEH